MSQPDVLVKLESGLIVRSHLGGIPRRSSSASISRRPRSWGSRHSQGLPHHTVESIELNPDDLS